MLITSPLVKIVFAVVVFEAVFSVAVATFSVAAVVVFSVTAAVVFSLPEFDFVFLVFPVDSVCSAAVVTS